MLPIDAYNPPPSPNGLLSTEVDGTPPFRGHINNSRWIVATQDRLSENLWERQLKREIHRPSAPNGSLWRHRFKQRKNYTKLTERERNPHVFFVIVVEIPKSAQKIGRLPTPLKYYVEETSGSRSPVQ